MRRIILTVSIISFCGIIAAQSGTDSIRNEYNKAFYYMRGIYKPYDPPRAFNIMKGLADNGFAKAMNALGVMYAQGTGTDVDYLAAYEWFENAAQAGYYKAYFNMAMQYKYGYGVERNESKALEYCTIGADLGDPDCQYAVGYMSFKGLSCQQDYDKAFEMFSNAAAAGNTAASYMIGLCYRNGYGIKKDESEGRRWLETSSTRGNVRATRELSLADPENHLDYGTVISEIKYNIQIPETYSAIEHDISDVNIAGKYTGYIVKYDWSGEYVISLTTLKLNLQTNGSKVTGLWTESDTSHADINAMSTDTGLVFTNVKYKRTDHYRSVPIQFEFKKASLQIAKNDSAIYLNGNIQFFSDITMEPEKPMYISLIKTDTAIDPDPDPSDKPIKDLKAFPNPFSDQLTISFNLNEESNVNAQVFTSDGRKLYQADFGRLTSGINIQRLQLEVPYGIYIVKVSSGTYSVTTKIVR